MPPLVSPRSRDHLQASSLRAVLRGETSRLSPQAPLSLWCGLKPARPFGPVDGRCRDSPKQYGDEDRPALRPHASGIRFGRSSSPAGRSPWRRASAFDAAPCGRGHPGTARRRLASAFPHRAARSPRAIPSARIKGDTPLIAVASSGDSQQHGRLGHGDRAARWGNGRIGYWYTNSRFARRAIVAKARQLFRKRSRHIDLNGTRGQRRTDVGPGGGGGWEPAVREWDASGRSGMRLASR